MAHRRTLNNATPRIDGVGLHTGAPSWVRLLPSESGDGIVFRTVTRRTRRATAAAVADTRRCTALDIAGTRFSTVEHLMSALAGSGITDAVIEFDGPEAPILDGSARLWVEQIAQAGIRELASEVAPIIVAQPMDIRGEKGECIVALPSAEFAVTVVLDYPDHPAIGTQAASFREGEYASQIAPARTYGFWSEFEQVRAAGLATGASLDNCIALNDDGSADERTPLRFANEPARHKLLDVIGDLALAGRPIQAEIVAIRPSHAVNCTLARRLAALG